MKRRVGLVGAGYICEYHIAAIRRLPDVELVGVTDLDELLTIVRESVIAALG